MKRLTLLLSIAAMLTISACSRSYMPGDFYSEGGLKGIVVTADEQGKPTLLLAPEETKGVTAAEAKEWVESYGDGGWHLPTKEEMEQVKKYKTLINKTLEQKKQPVVLTNHTFYWTSTPCSESHTYACGPDGLHCYFSTNNSPYYRGRGVSEM